MENCGRNTYVEVIASDSVGCSEYCGCYFR